MKKIIKISVLLFVVTISSLYSIDIKQKFTAAKQALKGLEAWQNPDLRLRYDQVCFLGSHNAFAAIESGFVYPQQRWSIKKQLDNGIRVLLPDFHLDSGVARLCHNKCSVSRALRAGSQNETVLSFLEMLTTWLNEHPDQIITVEIENYIGNDKTFALIKQANLLPYALTVKDWNPSNHDQQWPTLKWMIDKNKRLVIFDTENPSQYGYNTDLYMQRNQYGTFDKDKAAEPRHGTVITTKPRIFQLNYFGTVSSPLPTHNTPIVLKELIAKIRAKGYLRPDQPINEIVLDFVDLGNAMSLVNELNREYAQKYLSKD